MGSYSTAQKTFPVRLHTGERRIVLLVGDAIVAGLALFVATYIWWTQDWIDSYKQMVLERIPTWFFLMPFIWLLLNVEMYDIRRAGRRKETIKGIAIAALISLTVYLFVFFFTSPKLLPRRSVLTFIVLSASFTLIWRFLYIQVFTAPEFMRRVLIVGAGRSGTTLVQVFKEIWPPPFFLVGLIDDDVQKHKTCVEGFPVLGGAQDLLQIIESERVTDLIFAITNEMSDDTFESLLLAEEAGAEVTTMPMAYENLLGRVPIFLLRSDWILRSFVDEVHGSGVYELGKRLLDIVGGVVGVVLFMLLMPFISISIFLESGRPVFYTQNRMGKHGREYKIIKFRTMRQKFDARGKLLPDKDRITKIGKILRKSHLDELPQFINVLRGEMSLVGPRAEISQLVNDLQEKVPFYRARLLVKPGITGWAQINYGYATTVEETAVKLEYDLFYIKHRNLMLDIVILLRTFGTVVGFRGQ